MYSHKGFGVVSIAVAYRVFVVLILFTYGGTHLRGTHVFCVALRPSSFHLAVQFQQGISLLVP